MLIRAKTKPNVESLYDHNQKILRIVKGYIDETKILLKYSKILNIDESILKNLLFNTIFFHDIGKSSIEAQKALDNETKAFHALYSAMLIRDINEFKINDANVVALSVLTHHSGFKKELYESVNINVRYYEENIKTFVTRHYENSQKFFGLSPISSENIKLKFDYTSNNVKDFKDKLIGIYHRQNIMHNTTIRDVYFLLQGLLKIGDWIASSGKDASSFENEHSDILERNIFDSITNKIKMPVEWKEFQSKCKNIDKNLILIAATGSGKTEASILWAINNLKNKYQKIVYTLPTKVTDNKMYDRLCSIFGDNRVGLVHSSADIYLEEKGLEDEQNFDRTFMKPITVTTLDSFLLSFINIGNHTMRKINLNNALIIFDEIHAYDLKILGFLKAVLEKNKEKDMLFAFVSATFPELIKNEFRNTLDFEEVYDREEFKKSPYSIFLEEKSIFDENIIKEILAGYKKGKKIIIRLNTVKRSVDMYRDLMKIIPCEDIMLYNSNFTPLDKKLKEDELFKKQKCQKGFVVVATSIIQISLDINFDALYTELCPIDDIFQAGGRINRDKKRDFFANLSIFTKIENNNPYKNVSYYLENTLSVLKTIKLRTPFLLSDSLDLINKVYDKKVSNFSFFEEGYSLYSSVKCNASLSNISLKGEEINLRTVNIKQIQCFPYGNETENLLKENKRALKNYAISLPFWFYKGNPSYFEDIENFYLKKCLVKYSYDLGLQWFPVDIDSADIF